MKGITTMRDLQVSDGDIAIIGMSGRFPGVRNIAEFWQKLEDGVECIAPLSEDQMRKALLESLGYIPETLLTQWLGDPRYIKAAAALDDIDLFDAEFFGYTAVEADLLDPQQRLFLECAWEVMEDAGYDLGAYKGLIGVYAGAEESFYHHDLLTCVLPAQRDFLTLLGNGGSYLATRVSYKLNCKGPSFNIQSACSTSLVALHVACQSLKSGECDLALAGGVVAYPTQKVGYFYHEGGLVSPDGHCRPFDAQAQGTVLAHGGVGAVLLKPLQDALEDGDNIYAVIKGSATNNDGSLKAGYATPGIGGQVRVVAEALAVADIDPEAIGYIEAHGSATPLGDSAEIAAFTQAFRYKTQKKQFCAIGSVKSNLGHLGAASGIAALVKTVLALHHEKIPPSLYFEHPNPLIDFANSPFYVNTKLTEWKRSATPRRAGVHSQGIGGSNAHIILEEAPALAVSKDEPSRPLQMLVLSARTKSALESATANLITHFTCHPGQNLADVAYTLHLGRRAFAHRRVVLCHDLADAVQALRTMAPHRVFSASEGASKRSVAFVFPGEDAQYVYMGRDLYFGESLFHEHVAQCAELLKPKLGMDLREVLYPDEDKIEAAREKMFHPSFGPPALFVTSYALAKLWMSWGLHPAAVVGYKVGEYVAACLANVLTLEDALSLILLRDKPSAFAQYLQKIHLQVPTIPYVSSVTGTLIAANEVVNQLYWQKQHDQAPGFVGGMQLLLQNPENLLLVVGPGQLLRSQVGEDTDERYAKQVILASSSEVKDRQLNLNTVLTALGKLWLAGCQIDWAGFYAKEQRHRLSLPTYPFERQRYWIYPSWPAKGSSDDQNNRKDAMDQVIYSDTIEPRVLRPRPELAYAYVAPRNEIERILASILQELFGIAEVGVYDDFYDLGGHSLLAIRFVARMHKTFGLDLSVVRVLKMRTIAMLAEHVEEMLIKKIEELSDEEVRRITHALSPSL